MTARTHLVLFSTSDDHDIVADPLIEALRALFDRLPFECDPVVSVGLIENRQLAELAVEVAARGRMLYHLDLTEEYRP